MLSAEQNYRLLEEIDANRRFFLLVYQQNPQLLESAEARIKQIFEGSAAYINDSSRAARMTKQRGISLIELIMFIVIVGIALAGILLVMNNVSKNSSDPLIHKQSLAIAESLLEEVELMPFTFCDPDDVNAASAATANDCTGSTGGPNDENKGGASLTTPTPPSETRYAAPFFDNVADYGGFSTAASGIRDITGTAIAGLANYQANVLLTRQGATFLGGAAVAGDALQVTVTVTGPDSVPVMLDGVRTRYAPRP